jgi:uncharacterized membrane protein
MRHGYKLGRNANPLRYAVAGVVLILGVLVWLRPESAPNNPGATASIAVTTAAGATVGFKTVQAVLEQRCTLCHGALVQMKNVRLDSPERIKQHAQALYQQAVVSRIMPMNNATGITEAERTLIGLWFLGGAKTQ